VGYLLSMTTPDHQASAAAAVFQSVWSANGIFLINEPRLSVEDKREYGSASTFSRHVGQPSSRYARER
jgi:hypothetical protein